MRLVPQLRLRPLSPAAPSFTCEDRSCGIPAASILTPMLVSTAELATVYLRLHTAITMGGSLQLHAGLKSIDVSLGNKSQSLHVCKAAEPLVNPFARIEEVGWPGSDTSPSEENGPVGSG